MERKFQFENGFGKKIEETRYTHATYADDNGEFWMRKTPNYVIPVVRGCEVKPHEKIVTFDGIEYLANKINGIATQIIWKQKA